MGVPQKQRDRSSATCVGILQPASHFHAVKARCCRYAAKSASVQSGRWTPGCNAEGAEVVDHEIDVLIAGNDGRELLRITQLGPAQRSRKASSSKGSGPTVLATVRPTGASVLQTKNPAVSRAVRKSNIS